MSCVALNYIFNVLYLPLLPLTFSISFLTKSIDTRFLHRQKGRLERGVRHMDGEVQRVERSQP